MGNGQVLRVIKAEEWLRRPPSRSESAHGDCVVIRSSKSGSAAEISTHTAGSRTLRLHLTMIPPGTRGMPHFHADHESAIYTVSGETEIWHGDGLVKRAVVHAGDFMYIPPGAPHLMVNRNNDMAIAVIASTDPEARESVVVVELPRHLADLLSLPVSVGGTP